VGGCRFEMSFLNRISLLLCLICFIASFFRRRLHGHSQFTNRPIHKEVITSDQNREPNMVCHGVRLLGSEQTPSLRINRLFARLHFDLNHDLNQILALTNHSLVVCAFVTKESIENQETILRSGYTLACALGLKVLYF